MSLRRLLLPSAAGLALFGGAVSAQVSLTATGGTTAATYATVGAAFAAINAGTHTGAIALNLTANTTETTAQLTASGGSAAYSSVVIRPSGGAARTISGTVSGNAVLRFTGATNVTIDGLNTVGNSLTVQNLSTAVTGGTGTIRFENGASSNLITNATLRGSFSGPITSLGGTVILSTDPATGGGNDNNTISNCNFGPVGANLPTKHIHGSGSTTTLAAGNSGNVIQNNNLFDYFNPSEISAAIYINAGCTAWTITGNRFFQTAARVFTATTATHAAIQIQSSAAVVGAQGFSITDNLIGFASSAQTGTYALSGSQGKFTGILFSGLASGTLSTIAGNTIANVSLTGVASAGTLGASPFIGIRLDPGNADVNSNIIGDPATAGSLLFSTTSTSGVHMYGIFSNAADTFDFTASNNTIAGLTLTVPASNTTTSLLAGMRMSTTANLAFAASSNLIGSTSGPLLNNSGSTGSQAWGIVSDVAAVFTGNTVQNLSAAGTAVTTGASVVGLFVDNPARDHSVTQNLVFNLTNPTTAAATTVTGLLFRGGSGSNLIGKNIIRQLGLASSATGSRLNGLSIISGSGTTTIERNFIHSFNDMPAGGVMSGMLINGGTGLYRNNFIRLGLNPAGGSNAAGVSVRGINHTTGINDLFYHNSVYVGGTGVTDSGLSYAFESDELNNDRTLLNNIFVNARSNGTGTGTHYAIRISSPSFFTSDYNVFLASGPGGVLGQVGGANLASLAAWQTAAATDTHSYQSDPKFVLPAGDASTVDLHLNPTLATVAEGNGLALANVTEDFDGDLRSSLTPADIGADAGIFLSGTNPAAGTLNLSVSQGRSLVTAGATILAACSDPNNLALTLLSAGPAGTQGGSASLGGGNVTYSLPNAQFTGTDSFNYVVRNSAGRRSTGTINVSVDAPLFPPQATGIVLLNAGGSFSGTYSGVPGLSYAIEFSDSLAVGFQPLLNASQQPITVTADANGTFTFTAAQSPVPAKRFYRARAQ